MVKPLVNPPKNHPINASFQASPTGSFMASQNDLQGYQGRLLEPGWYPMVDGRWSMVGDSPRRWWMINGWFSWLKTSPIFIWRSDFHQKNHPVFFKHHPVDSQTFIHHFMMIWILVAWTSQHIPAMLIHLRASFGWAFDPSQLTFPQRPSRRVFFRRLQVVRRSIRSVMSIGSQEGKSVAKMPQTYDKCYVM